MQEWFRKSDFYSYPLTLDTLTLIEVSLPQKEAFRSAIGVRKSRRALIIRWTDKDGAVGYGECSCRPDPYFSAEFMSGAQMLTREHLFPLVRDVETFGDLHRRMRRVRGWPFTRAAMEFAAYDIISKREGHRLPEALELKQASRIPVGISIGLQPDEEELVKVSERALQNGYQRLKFKIAPDTNPRHFENLIRRFPDAYVRFDANGTFREPNMEKLGAFYELTPVIEQPFPPGRFDLYRKAKKAMPKMKVCWDEEVASPGEAHKLLGLGVLDELNLKPGRVGGVINSFTLIRFCMRNNISCWVGGMFETGIGRSANLRIAACLPEAKAHDLSPSDRYFQEDVLQQPITMHDGFVDLSSAKQAKVNEEVLSKYTVNAEQLKA